MTEIRKDRHLQLRLRAPLACAEEVCERLLGVGASGVEWVDETCLDRPADLLSGEVELRFSFGPGAGGQADLQDCERLVALDERVRLVRQVELDPADWATAWRAHHRAVRAGRFFVHPEWVSAAGEACPVLIDPGMAFGTGLHPTTRMCLLGLDRALPARRVLDLGCGSGVLALAAARAGVPEVWAVDNDPEACRVTAENAERNGLERVLTIRQGDIETAEGTFDLVLANILSGPLVAMAPGVARRIVPDGRVLLSGLLQEEAPEVTSAYRAVGFQLEHEQHEDEWVALAMLRGKT
ncbi:MAG: 50S ribosomal protein L11 methyltransferase [Myxococcales bacterium]|nr:50S ribosomal protein L11 methyltransferase [Myxococcales bacterium]